MFKQKQKRASLDWLHLEYPAACMPIARHAFNSPYFRIVTDLGRISSDLLVKDVSDIIIRPVVEAVCRPVPVYVSINSRARVYAGAAALAWYWYLHEGRSKYKHLCTVEHVSTVLDLMKDVSPYGIVGLTTDESILAQKLQVIFVMQTTLPYLYDVGLKNSYQDEDVSFSVLRDWMCSRLKLSAD